MSGFHLEPGESGEAVDELCKLHARRVGLVPSRIIACVGCQVTLLGGRPSYCKLRVI